ncbi:hypothetical protein REIP_0951 [Rickettsia endosymbiont of Ixodes pacificus]|uniref:hypothetical protein n=1 Tax=Rickettsia endosymbiont of Ixodes pacificus TaxID=1133329 RepID=UPI00061EC591|nr:hypothetical protein [Rickettsia endosymbiont of Ixodes pacificus]KJW02933.1 hypothetical protein REIP_0951 [Rickettsia endosymbiont of Ixodes pacificus]
MLFLAKSNIVAWLGFIRHCELALLHGSIPSLSSHDLTTRYDTERIFRATQPTAARNDEKKTDPRNNISTGMT